MLCVSYIIIGDSCTYAAFTYGSTIRDQGSFVEVFFFMNGFFFATGCGWLVKKKATKCQILVKQRLGLKKRSWVGGRNLQHWVKFVYFFVVWQIVGRRNHFWWSFPSPNISLHESVTISMKVMKFEILHMSSTVYTPSGNIKGVANYW